MKMIGFNGSPRKTWNTATLVKKALDGGASQGAETELIHLVDLDFSGCKSCFACKLKNGRSYGKCALEDELTPVLSAVGEADALVLGAPNYLGAPSGLAKSFLERLVYPYIVYDANMSSLFKRVMPTGFIYTMASADDWMRQMGYDMAPRFMEGMLKMFFGAAESLVVNDTYQFGDYSKYVTTRFDPVAKARSREQRFPLDCEKAFEMGVRLIRQAAVYGR